MSAVLEAREPGARYLESLEPALVRQFDLLATAPGGVARLRELILTLAVQGKLVPQDSRDEPGSALLGRIFAEKNRLIASGQSKRDRSEAAPQVDDSEVLPAGWASTLLGEVSLVSGGVTLGRKGSLIEPVTLPYLRVANVQRWRVEMNELKQVTIARSELQRFALRSGDLLITEGGDWDKVGRSAIWRGELPECLHQNHVFKLRGMLNSWNSEWAQLYLNSPVARTYFASCAKQTTNLASINMTQLKACRFPLPPLAEQARIVARVDDLMRLCDALEAKGRLEAAQHAQLLSILLGTLTDSASPEELAANWQRIADHFDLLLDRPEAVDALEQTILQLAVRGLLVPQDPTEEPASVLLERIRAEKDRLIAEGKIKRESSLSQAAGRDEPFELPATWAWTQIGEVVDFLNGYAFKSEWFKTKGLRLLRNLNVGHGQIDWSQPVFVETVIGGQFEQFQLSEGDVVLSLDRPIISTGLKCAVVGANDLPCLLLQRVARLSPMPAAMSRDYLMLWLQSDLFVGTIDPGRSNGVPHISTKQIASMVVGLPPLAEQSRIVARVEELQHLCTALRQRLAAIQTTQSHLAEALVKQAAA